MGKFITSRGFTTALGSLEYPSIANVLYAYDAPNGETIISEAKKSICLCDNMDDSFINHIYDEEAGVRVDTCTELYYPDNPSSQLVPFTNENAILV